MLDGVDGVHAWILLTKNGWFIIENPIKMGWFGGKTHHFRKHPYAIIPSSVQPRLHFGSRQQQGCHFFHCRRQAPHRIGTIIQAIQLLAPSSPKPPMKRGNQWFIRPYFWGRGNVRGGWVGWLAINCVWGLKDSWIYISSLQSWFELHLQYSIIANHISLLKHIQNIEKNHMNQLNVDDSCCFILDQASNFRGNHINLTMNLHRGKGWDAPPAVEPMHWAARETWLWGVPTMAAPGSQGATLEPPIPTIVSHRWKWCF